MTSWALGEPRAEEESVHPGRAAHPNPLAVLEGAPPPRGGPHLAERLGLHRRREGSLAVPHRHRSRVVGVSAGNWWSRRADPRARCTGSRVRRRGRRPLPRRGRRGPDAAWRSPPSPLPAPPCPRRRRSRWRWSSRSPTARRPGGKRRGESARPPGRLLSQCPAVGRLARASVIPWDHGWRMGRDGPEGSNSQPPCANLAGEREIPRAAPPYPSLENHAPSPCPSANESTPASSPPP